MAVMAQLINNFCKGAHLCTVTGWILCDQCRVATGLPQCGNFSQHSEALLTIEIRVFANTLQCLFSQSIVKRTFTLVKLYEMSNLGSFRQLG